MKNDYQSLRTWYSDPYIQNVASMSLTELGREASKIEKTIKRSWKTADPIRIASFLQAVRLRTAKNLTLLYTKQDIEKVCKKAGIDKSSFNEYYILKDTINAIDDEVAEMSGCDSLQTYHEEYGFMQTVMTAVEIGNSLLKKQKAKSEL